MLRSTEAEFLALTAAATPVAGAPTGVATPRASSHPATRSQNPTLAEFASTPTLAGIASRMLLAHRAAPSATASGTGLLQVPPGQQVLPRQGRAPGPAVVCAACLPLSVSTLTEQVAYIFGRRRVPTPLSLSRLPWFLVTRAIVR